MWPTYMQIFNQLFIFHSRQSLLCTKAVVCVCLLKDPTAYDETTGRMLASKTHFSPEPSSYTLQDLKLRKAAHHHHCVYTTPDYFAHSCSSNCHILITLQVYSTNVLIVEYLQDIVLSHQKLIHLWVPLKLVKGTHF